MTERERARAYLDGFRTLSSVLDLDVLTQDEVLLALNPDLGRDPLLTPWKRGYNDAIRSAFGR